MFLGDRVEFVNGSYEVRGMVDGRFVVRLRNRKSNAEAYLVRTENERAEFDREQVAKKERMERDARTRADNADRNAQIYERNLAGETKASLAREFSLSPTTIGHICAKQARKERR